MPPTPQELALAQLFEKVYDGWAGEGLVVGGKTEKLVRANTFAFLIGVILDEQMPAGQAWANLLYLKERLDLAGIPFTPEGVAGVHLNTLRKMANQKPCLHRFPNKAAKRIKDAAKLIVDSYDGDADEVLETYTAREAYFRLLDFNGISDKKANMAIRLLTDEWGYEYYDTHLIGVPVDVHVKRLFRRTGLVPPKGDRAEIQQKAIELLPANPWKFDSAFFIGTTWCTAQNAWCEGYPETEDDEALEPCPLAQVCPRLIEGSQL